MYSESNKTNTTTAQSSDTSANTANRTPITVTGCLQEAKGLDNFVLSNVSRATQDSGHQVLGYRIEEGNDLEQHVGKQVKIRGWLDARHSAQAQTDTSDRRPTSGQAGTSAQAMSARDVDYDDLTELHVESIEKVSDTCGNAK